MTDAAVVDPSLPSTTVVGEGSNAGRIWFPQLLRAVACMVVLLEHLGNGYPRALQDAAKFAHYNAPAAKVIHTPWFAIGKLTDSPNFSLGFMAVACFFLVSGFVIPFSLRQSSVAEFTAKRVFRLYPTLAGCVLATVCVSIAQSHFEGVGQPFGLKAILTTVTLSATFQHMQFVDPVAWTLVVEEMFYVTAAVIVWRKFYGHRVPLVAIGVAFLAIAAIPAKPSSGVYMLSFYAAFVPFVFVGTAIHHVFVREWELRDGLLVGGALFGCFTVSMYLSGNNYQASSYVRSSVAAIVVFVALAWVGPRLRYSPLLDQFSKITYPLYLLHFMNGVILLNWFATKHVSFLVALPITIAIAIAGAVAVHLLIEEPAVKVGRRIARNVRERRAARAAAALDVAAESASV